MMRLGVNLWTVYGWEPAEFVSPAVLEALRQMKADAVELVIGEGCCTVHSLIAESSRLLPRLQDLGLRVPGIASRLFWKYNLASSDEVLRRGAIEAIAEQCEVARAYNAQVALVVAGSQEPRSNYDRQYANAVHSLQTAAARAGELGVTIGVENVAGTFLTSPREFAQFLRDVGSPWVRAYLDLGNVSASGLQYPENWVSALAGSIAMVHVKDHDRSVGTWRGFRLCGQGDLDWPLMLGALREAAYDGYLIIETPPDEVGRVPRYPEDGLEAARTGLEFLRCQLAG